MGQSLLFKSIMHSAMTLGVDIVANESQSLHIDNCYTSMHSACRLPDSTTLMSTTRGSGCFTLY